MDKLEAMAIFVEVVDRGTLSAAARYLHIPLPTLSRKLGELENHLGTRLLVRTTRRLELTDAGADYLQAAKRILEQVNEADRGAVGEYVTPKGELLITAPLTFGRLHVLPIINAFLAQYPDVNVRLALSDARLELISEHIDVAVRIGPPGNGNLSSTRIGELRWMVVASPDFLKKHGAPKTPADLAARPCVGVDHVNLSTHWRFRSPASGAVVNTPIRARLSPTSAEAAVDAAIAGVGLTQVLHYQAADGLAAGKLCVVLAEYEAEPMPLWLVYTGQSRLPLKVRSFLDFATPRLKETIRFTGR
ncbi:LysR family transcriptional regulator [Sodalis ligni]|jgi:DNA-binding transcriptional LysR family regulator|uniref:DNA-binding transcriptional LysR family regulator n=1 Tax=Sodalis ligni TaxID=2697027 RepID=A0A4R1NM06_9GAMM|nr:LysR family transcriptional regulator [Sodalis ligni]QWA09697.1 LysR family transcriptional regulator [Sodalis ligni]TCL07021.1 DNA-binding transcriptional LysR family regulator [Sodalis ligni]